MTVDADARDPRPRDPVAQVLVVCHANIARSPLAMAMLEDQARQRLGPAPDVWVRSAGVRAVEGRPAASGTRAQAQARGLALEAHRSAPLSRVDLVDADLVVTMSERQRGHAVQLHPGALHHTFTLVELARLCARLQPMEEGLAVRSRVRSVAWAASQSRPFVPGPEDPEDVADPFGGPDDGYAEMAEHVEAAVGRIADVLFGPAGASGSGSPPSGSGSPPSGSGSPPSGSGSPPSGSGSPPSGSGSPPSGSGSPPSRGGQRPR